MTDESDYDTTEKVERTDRGYRLTVESTRGTGTRDQDSVKLEARTEDHPEQADIEAMIHDVAYIMNQRRAHQPDGDDGE